MPEKEAGAGNLCSPDAKPVRSAQEHEVAERASEEIARAATS